MKDLLLPLLHLAVTAAKLCRPGGVRAVIAENLLLKQQLIVRRRSRQRAPNLRVGDRLLCGFGALFLSPGRIRKVAIGLRPSTLLTFHQALVRGKYRRLFSSSARPRLFGSYALMKSALAQPRCHRSRGRTNTDRLPDQQRMAQAPREQPRHEAEIGVRLARVDELVDLVEAGEVVSRPRRGRRQGATVGQLDTGDHVAEGNKPISFTRHRLFSHAS